MEIETERCHIKDKGVIWAVFSEKMQITVSSFSYLLSTTWITFPKEEYIKLLCML